MSFESGARELRAGEKGWQALCHGIIPRLASGEREGVCMNCYGVAEKMTSAEDE